MKVGDIVYLAQPGRKGLKRARVSRVGRKYFYIDYISWWRFKLSDLMLDNYNPIHNERCYLSVEDYYNDILNRYIKDKVKDAFSCNSTIKLTEDQYRQIYEILGFKVPDMKELAVTVE